MKLLPSSDRPGKKLLSQIVPLRRESNGDERNGDGTNFALWIEKLGNGDGTIFAL
jgi:hypothetical protein